jgi:hypothetical protein
MHDRIKAKKHFYKGLKDYARGKVAHDLQGLKPRPPAPVESDPLAEGADAAPPDEMADLKSNPELLQKLLAELQAKQ